MGVAGSDVPLRMLGVKIEDGQRIKLDLADYCQHQILFKWDHQLAVSFAFLFILLSIDYRTLLLRALL